MALLHQTGLSTFSQINTNSYTFYNSSFPEQSNVYRFPNSRLVRYPDNTLNVIPKTPFEVLGEKVVSPLINLGNRVISILQTASNKLNIIPGAQAAPIKENTDLLKTTTKTNEFIKKLKPKNEHFSKNKANLKNPPQRVGKEFQVNTQEIGTQTILGTGKFNDENFAVTWISNLLGSKSVHGQIFNSDGTKNGSELLLKKIINETVSSFVTFGNDRLCITWHVAKDSNCYWEMFDSEGKSISTTKVSDSCDVDNFNIYTATSLTSDLAILSWPDSQEPSDNIGQILYANGSSSKLFPMTFFRCINAQTTKINADKFVDIENDDGVRGNFYYMNGTKDGDVFPISKMGTDGSSATAALNDNESVVVFLGPAYLNVYGQVMNVYGARVGTFFQANEKPMQNGTLNNPKVIGFETEEYFVIWQRTESTTASAIFGQMFHSNRTKDGNEFQINLKKNEDASFPSPIKLNESRFVIIWQGDANIYGQIFEKNILPFPNAPASSSNHI